jgi:Fe2+ or Zn2+ uptake regulation protein
MTTAVDRMTQSGLPSLAHAKAIGRQADARVTRLRRPVFAVLARKRPAVDDRVATIVREWSRRLGFEVEAETLEASGACSSCRGEADR